MVRPSINEKASSGERASRLAITGLSMVGTAEAIYMLAYDEGLLDSLICPFFGEGCNTVGRSEHAVHLGVPNAAVGIASYAAMAALALWAGDKPPSRRPWQLLGLAATSSSALAASLFLIWEQATKVRAWCFWCLTSALVNALIFPMALWQGLRALRSLIAVTRPRASTP